jgi:hypothetical protein
MPFEPTLATRPDPPWPSACAWRGLCSMACLTTRPHNRGKHLAPIDRRHCLPHVAASGLTAFKQLHQGGFRFHTPVGSAGTAA